MQAYIFLYSARSKNQIKTCRISFLLPVDEEHFPYGLNPSTDLSDGGSISHRWMILLIWLSFFSPAACRWNFSFDWGKIPFEGVQTTLPGHSNLPVLKICQFTSEINNNCKVLRSFCGAHQAHNAQVCTWFVFLTWLVATLAGDMFGKSSEEEWRSSHSALQSYYSQDGRVFLRTWCFFSIFQRDFWPVRLLI